MAQSLANVLALLRKMFAREELPEPPPHGPPQRSRPGAFRHLFGAEALPEDPVPRDGKPGFFSLMLGPEVLPEDPLPPRPARPGFLSLVLGVEALPEDPVPPRRRGRWIAWLFSPERIDRS